METLLAGLFVLTVVIAFHEFAHLVVARLNGVKVRRYSIGFGPVLLKKRIGETDYCISLIPLGGYVQLAGHQESAEACKDDDPKSLFDGKSVGARMAIVAAGPASNYLLAFVIFMSLCFFAGTPVITSRVMEVTPNSPAMKAGIHKGDMILAIDGTPVMTFNGVQSALDAHRGNSAVRFLIARGSQRLTLTAQIPLGPAGIAFGDRVFKDPHHPIRSVRFGEVTLYNLNKMAVVGFRDMFHGKVAARDAFSGPIAIVSLSGQMFRVSTYAYLLWIGMISFAVGFMNFLPIPVVDGGYLALYLLEIVRGKPLARKTQEVILTAGMFLMLALMIFSVYFDIARLFHK